MAIEPPPWVTRVVDFTFNGRRLRVGISTELFSSAQVDAGTMLLLKLIAQQVPPDRRRRFLDLGCGTGVVGLALAADNPDAVGLAQDRDGLAVVCTQWNAAANGLGNLRVDCGTALTHTAARRFDLVASNLPAKAGPAVLKHLIAGLKEVLGTDGQAALVVVSPLSEQLLAFCDAAGLAVTADEKTKNHHALLLRQKTEADGPAAPGDTIHTRTGLVRVTDKAPYGFLGYDRGTARAHGPRAAIKIDTVRGLPEFDKLAFQTELLIGSLERLAPPAQTGGSALVINPGQGYLPLALAQMTRPEYIDLAARDGLELIASARAFARARPRESRLYGKSCIGTTAALFGSEPSTALRRSYDWVVANLHPTHPALLEGLVEVAANRTGNTLFVAGRSTDIVRLQPQLRSCMPGTRVVFDRKSKGSRVLVIARA